MNTNPDTVLVTNYDEIVRYFKNFPEQLHAPVSNNESRPISPLENNTNYTDYKRTK